jgi:hypothetical protein
VICLDKLFFTAICRLHMWSRQGARRAPYVLVLYKHSKIKQWNHVHTLQLQVSYDGINNTRRSTRQSSPQMLKSGLGSMSLATSNAIMLPPNEELEVMMSHQLQLTPMHQNGLPGNFSQMDPRWLLVHTSSEVQLIYLKTARNFWLLPLITNCCLCYFFICVWPSSLFKQLSYILL